MYTFVLVSHNLLRWLVVLAGVVAVVRGWRGWMARGAWSDGDLKAAKAFAGLISLQLLLGIALYAVSPLIRQGMADMSTAMKTPSVRYFLVEHSVMMFITVALAHIGLARVKRATTDMKRFQAVSIWMGIALAAVLGFIPWQRPLFPF
jgi:hypothetical protein